MQAHLTSRGFPCASVHAVGDKYERLGGDSMHEAHSGAQTAFLSSVVEQSNCVRRRSSDSHKASLSSERDRSRGHA